MQKKLFIPGPTDVSEDVLEKMAQPLIGHRTKEATEMQKRISENLQKLMFTQNTILLSTSSGTGLMEGAIRSLTKKGAAVFSCGAFGKRWYELAKSNGKTAELFSSEMGEPTTPEMVEKALKTGKYDVVTVTHNETSTGVMNPVKEIGEVVKNYPGVLFLVDAVSSLGGVKIETDAWGIDVLISSSQKCLALPPGLALASVSEAAYERAKTVEERGYYFDLVKLCDRVKKDFQYPSTPSLSHMFAMDYQLDKIIRQEGLENRFARHEKMADMTRKWAEKNGFALFAREGFRSNTVSCLWDREGMDFNDFKEKLSAQGYSISNGYGDLKGKTMRIAHMGDRTEEEMNALFAAMEKALA